MTPDWIAVDWGTTSLRVWAMADAQPLAARQSADGMGKLSPADFEPALLQLIADWLGDRPMPVIACGMVGARQGWAEAAYRQVPRTPLGHPLQQVRANDPRLQLQIIPGLSQAGPPDVMRGEETQIAGYLALNPGFDGVICLPGTHAKWAEIHAGRVLRFHTCMTGEIFALLADQSVLRHSLGAGWADTAFAAAIQEILPAPENLPKLLFSLRAAALLQDLPGAEARARLSGLMIGAELAAMRPIWQGRQIALIGAGALAGHYATALGLAGTTAQLTDGTEITLAGLTAARRLLKETAA